MARSVIIVLLALLVLLVVGWLAYSEWGGSKGQTEVV